MASGAGRRLTARSRALLLVAALVSSACGSGEAARSGSVRTSLEPAREWRESSTFAVAGNEQWFGHDLAAVGDTALVDGEAAFLFERRASEWQLSQTLATPTKNDIVKHFALTADAAALSIDSDGTDQVVLYGPTDRGWEPRQTLTESDLGAAAVRDVGLNESLLVLAVEPEFEQLRVLAFARTGDALDAPRVVFEGEELLEYCLALSGDQVLIGDQFAPSPEGGEGVVHVYSLIDGAWLETQTLSAPEASSVRFGLDVAASARRVVVGTRTGQVYLFERDAAGFGAPVRIDPPSDMSAAAHAVALNDFAVLVGLPDASPVGLPSSGAAYMAFEGAEGWSDSVWLPRGEPMASEYFGYGVALTETAALVAVPSRNLPFSLGAVQVYGRCASDGDCPVGHLCDSSGACAAQKRQGEACNPARDCALANCQECESSFCADGYCCDRACDDQCEACAEPGHVGQCRAVDGEPRPGRPACAGDDITCAGNCDGRSSGCVYAPALAPCGSECSDGLVTPYTCDGAGSCSKAAVRACAGYVCVDDACGTACERDDDCLPGFSCIGRACAPVKFATCSKDGSASVGRDGTSGCLPYRCEPDTGLCGSDCRSTADCSEGYVCETTRRACVFETKRAPSDEGCGCKLGAARSEPRPLWLALALLAACRRRGREART